MQRTSFQHMQCPIARGLERVGEWWSILILREALAGATRFEQFQKSLPIAPTMLTRRLNGLVAAGLLERRLYSERPPRHEYVLLPAGRDFRPVLVALLAWGNAHFAPEGASVLIVETTTGRVVDPVVVDRSTGRPIRPGEHRFVAGPAADARLRAKLAARESPSGTNGPRPARVASSRVPRPSTRAPRGRPEARRVR